MPDPRLNTETLIQEQLRQAFLQRVQEAADLVEATAFTDPKYKPEPGSRKALCGTGAQLCKEALIYNSAGEPNPNITAGTYNVWLLHYVAEGHSFEEAIAMAQLNSETPWDPPTEAALHSLMHAICIAYDTVSDTYVLMDRTFWQFINSKLEVFSRVSSCGTVIRELNSGKIEDLPLIKALLNDGYFVLNDQTLRDYLAITATKEYWETHQDEKFSVPNVVKNLPVIQDHLSHERLSALLGREL